MLFTREYIVEKSPLNESFFKYFSLSPGKILERSQCDESLILKSNLVSQQKMHKGEKPLKFDQCVKSFTIKDILVSHQKSNSGRNYLNVTNVI